MARLLIGASLIALPWLLSCSATANYSHPARVLLSCNASAPPIKSEADAICHGRHWAALESSLISYLPQYSAQLNSGIWSIFMGPLDSAAEMIWEIDADSAQLIRIHRNPVSP